MSSGGLPPGEPPIPIGATYDPITREIIVTFDRALTAGSLDTTNWSIIIDHSLYIPDTTVVAAGSSVTWTHSLSGAFDARASLIYYAATPPDLLSDIGYPADAFAIPYTEI